MSTPLALVWDLIALDNASATFKKVGAAAESTAAKTSTMQDAFVGAGAVIGLAAVGIGAISAKMAMTFQQSMLLIHTQANASTEEVKTMTQAILDLAGPVATAPEALALSLYHVESVGLRGAQALEVVKIAAEGAKVGNADLEQVTNALTAAVASGIPGVQDMTSAMGQLNTIVGAGDMKMQDLNEALGSGLLTVVKGFGLSLTDVGAALATFGDNNIRGADAATQLRMAVQAMAKPVKGGEKTLKALGIASGQLAKDMQEGGLNQALVDLRDHMDKAGVKSNEVGQVILDAFGKKAGVGIAVLEGQMPRFETKLKDIADAGNSFGSDWQAWLSTVGAKWDTLKASLEAIAIKIGTVLLPVIANLIGKFSTLVDWVLKNKTWLGEMAVAIVAVAAAIKIVSVATAAWNAIMTAGPIGIVVVALAGLVLGMIYAYNHSKAFHDVVVKAWTAIKAAAVTVVAWFETSAMPVITKVWDAIVAGAKSAAAWYEQNVAPTFAAFGEMMAALFNRIAVIVSWLWTHAFQPTMNTIIEYWKVIWYALQPILETAWNLIKNAFEAILAVFRAIFKVWTDIFKGDWSKVWDDIKGVFAAAWDGIVKGLHIAMDGLGKILSGVKDAMLRGLADASSWLVDVGKWVIQGLINGITGTAGLITKAISGVASGVVNTFKSILGIHSPSTVFHDFGVNIGQGVINGVVAMQSKVNAKIAGLVTVPTVGSTSPNYASGTYGANGQGSSGAGNGLPDTITLVDANGSLLGHMQVVAGRAVAQAQSSRTLAMSGGSR